MPIEADQIKIIEQFASPRTRLLVTGFDRAGRPTVEVAHEALIRTWKRLRDWIERQSGEAARARCSAASQSRVGSRTADVDEQRRCRRASSRSPRSRPAWRSRRHHTPTISGSLFHCHPRARKRERKQREAELSAEQTSNATLTNSLNKRQADLGHAQANILGQLSGTNLSRGKFDSALRLASHGMRIDLALPSDAVTASTATAALAAAVSQANWRFALGGHDGSVSSAAFSPDGSRIVTASADKTALIWTPRAQPR